MFLTFGKWYHRAHEVMQRKGGGGGTCGVSGCKNAALMGITLQRLNRTVNSLSEGRLLDFILTLRSNNKSKKMFWTKLYKLMMQH